MKLDLVYQEILPHPIERVWAALTSAGALRDWLMESDFEPAVGRPFTFRCPPGPGIRGFVECTVLELVPPRRVVWSWLATDVGRPTRVTFDLEPVPAGTRLTLRHEGDVAPEVGQRTAAGWTTKLRELVGYLGAADSHSPSPSPSHSPVPMTIDHAVVPRSEWIEARRRLLLREKEFTRLRDELNAARRALPWEAVEQEYRFDGPGGAESLAELFAGRSQLIVYHFMFGPESPAGCPHCSFWADSFDGGMVHLNHRDVTMVVVSRAPYSRLAAYQRRMGWRFKWVSSDGTTFNYDYQASFHPADASAGQALYNFQPQDPGGSDREGVSVFHRSSDGKVWHTYSTYARGIDLLNPTYNWLDLVPKGRDEGDDGQSWVRRHDEYR